MGGNFVENVILHDAILELQKQGDLGYRGDISQLNRPLMLTPEGKLTVVGITGVETTVEDGRKVRRKVCFPDTKYEPVDCYNIIPPGLDQSSAVSWYLNVKK